MKTKSIILPSERIIQHIYFIRGQRVMLSPDLAVLYGVEPRALVQAVKRNSERFPKDFMFQLTRSESPNLKSQFVISSWGGSRRAMPYAFTEQGVAMLSSVLRSERAVQVNIEIMRTFVRLRASAASYADLALRVDELETQYDAQFLEVFEALEQLTQEPEPTPRQIGFRTRERQVLCSRGGMVRAREKSIQHLETERGVARVFERFETRIQTTSGTPSTIKAFVT